MDQPKDDITIALTPPQLALVLAILILLFWLRRRARQEP